MDILKIRDKLTGKWIGIPTIVGPPGSDATVTAENIQSALGYTPADSSDVADKLTAPLTASVGQIFRVQSINEDGSLVLEAVDMPSGGGTSDYEDLENKPQINGVTLSGNTSNKELGVFNKYQYKLCDTLTVEEEGVTEFVWIPKSYEAKGVFTNSRQFLLQLTMPKVSAAKVMNVTASYTYVDAEGKTHNETRTVVTIPSGYQHISYTRCTTIEAFIRNSACFADISGGSTNLTSGTLSRAFVETAVPDNAVIHRLSLINAGGVAIPIGAELKIYM